MPLEYIYADELDAAMDAKAARAARDAFLVGRFWEGIAYNSDLCEMLDFSTYMEWYERDRAFNRAAAEQYCIQHNRDTMLFIYMANGAPILVRRTVPSTEEVEARYTEFIKWNGAKAFPFPRYMFVYMPVEAPPAAGPVLRRSARLAGKGAVDYAGMA
jgi:hypothetical protein